jgi:hypothetical protein
MIIPQKAELEVFDPDTTVVYFFTFHGVKLVAKWNIP